MSMIKQNINFNNLYSEYLNIFSTLSKHSHCHKSHISKKKKSSWNDINIKNMNFFQKFCILNTYVWFSIHHSFLIPISFAEYNTIKSHNTHKPQLLVFKFFQILNAPYSKICITGNPCKSFATCIVCSSAGHKTKELNNWLYTQLTFVI